MVNKSLFGMIYKNGKYIETNAWNIHIDLDWKATISEAKTDAKLASLG